MLCFDEFQVTDVADAMILKRLFEEMMRLGMRFVITSNRVPEDLYKGGLNRPLFLPFIHSVLRKEFVVLDLSSGKDYRLTGEKSLKSVYLYPINEENTQKIMETFKSLVHSDPVDEDAVVNVFGSRNITIPLSARGVCFFTFDQLIKVPFGASDYLAIARNFHTVIVNGVPRSVVCCFF